MGSFLNRRNRQHQCDCDVCRARRHADDLCNQSKPHVEETSGCDTANNSNNSEPRMSSSSRSENSCKKDSYMQMSAMPEQYMDNSSMKNSVVNEPVDKTVKQEPYMTNNRRNSRRMEESYSRMQEVKPQRYVDPRMPEMRGDSYSYDEE